MNTPYTSPVSDIQKFEAMSLEEKQTYIILWFEETNHPIKKPEDISHIIQHSDIILFWYQGENYSCPVEPWNERVKFYIDDSTKILTIRMGEKPQMPKTQQLIGTTQEALYCV